MRKWCRLTCLQEFNDTATRWVYGWSQLVVGHNEAEVTEVKPSQNFPLHSKTTLKPYKIWQRLAKSMSNKSKKQAKQQMHVLPAAKARSG